MAIFNPIIFLSCFFLFACELDDEDIDKQHLSSNSEIRFVTLAPHLTELLFSAGAGDSLVGSDRFSNYPITALGLPSIGDAFRIDYEKIIQLSPDFILSWKNGTPAQVTDYLSNIGLKVISLESSKLTDIPKQIEYLGLLANTSNIANLAAEKFRLQLLEIRQRHANLSLVSVFFQISNKPLVTVSNNHILADAIEICGGKNIFPNLNSVAPIVDFESIVAANPSAILVVAPEGEEDWESFWKPWSQMEAVAKENIYSVEADLVSRPGPRLIQGISQICDALAITRKSFLIDS